MSSAEWYELLLEKNITMEPMTAEGTKSFKATRAELSCPDNDWEHTRHMAWFATNPGQSSENP